MSTEPPRPEEPAAIPAPGRLRPPTGNEIQVWWARARFGELGDDLRRRLALDVDEATRARVARFHREQDRDRGLAAHSLLRRVLAGVAGGHPAELVLRTRCTGCGATDHGKPYLDVGTPRPPVEMNLSHSGDAVGVALAPAGAPIGVDVEQRRRVDWATLRPSVFADSEWLVTEAAPDPARRRTDFWSRKEAAVKSSGHGLSLSLRSVVVEDAQWGGWTSALPEGAGAVSGWDLDLAPDIAAAVARHDPDGPPARPSVHRVDLAAPS
jgi:4'-phosphopantetheinyl transferase